MIYLAADHRGFALKEKIKEWLKEGNMNFEDMGPDQYNKDDDYPDFGAKVGEKISQDETARGIVVCGSGVGISFAANKFKGVRAMIGFKDDQVEHGASFDHANVLSLSADHFNDEEIKAMIEVFLKTEPNQEERNLRRVAKIKQIEERNFV